MIHRFFASVLLLSSLHFTAQNEVDALRYSFSDFAGSARSAGMSGAFSAAGADLSSLHGNPAGLAAYRRGAAELNLSIRNLGSTSQFEAQNASQSTSNFNIHNVGIANVYHMPGSETKKIALGVSHAKTHFFHEKNVISGTYNSSILQSFVQQANGLTEPQVIENFPFTAGLAYETYLIDLDDTLNLQYRYNALPPADIRHSVTRTGNQSEISFGLAFKPADEWMAGFAIKMTSVDFTEEYNHNEDFVDTSDVREFNFSYDLQSLGDAYSVALGTIYSPLPQLRIGFSVESPALIRMDEYFTSSTTSDYLGGINSYTSPELQSSIVIRVPGKIQFQCAAFIGDAIIFSLDAERRSFQNSRIDGDGANTYEYSSENQIIQMIYKPASKLSIGIEGRITPQIHIRAGATYFESPYKKIAGILAEDVLRFAAGGGYRTETWSVDVALQTQQNQQQYFMFDPNLITPAIIKNSLTMITLGVGYRFKP